MSPRRARQVLKLTASLWLTAALSAQMAAAGGPSPLLDRGKPVDWWFVFKFRAQGFPGCGDDSGTRTCPFDRADPLHLPKPYPSFGQQFVYASSLDGTLQKGKGCVGGTLADPVGATFDQVYEGSFFYVIWNDQFYADPPLCGTQESCGAPWGHSKGILSWDDSGEGFVMQVSTPAWPGSGSKSFKRRIGNTLGCIEVNNVQYSQHFFALKLSKEQLVEVLQGLQNASVVTDPTNLQIVRNGGPADVRALVDALGKKSKSAKVLKQPLSTDVTLISKPSNLNVPPWQLVSALLGSPGERSATWWSKPRIYSTTKSSKVRCWDPALEAPGPVAIALTGAWHDEQLGLKGGQNHAKIGVTTSGGKHYAIFGDLNQQGTIAPPQCESSQNGRGGVFYVVENEDLFKGVTALIEGDTAPSKGPK